MNLNDLNLLLNNLTVEEKIGQLIQLTGDFFDQEDEIIETGPMTKLGLDDNKYDVKNTGSVLNVVNGKDILNIQKNYLEQSKHKIPLLFMADIIYGYKTILPIPLAQTCSWNFNLVKDGASMMAKECFEAGIHVTFSPMVDIVRDPRWGRVLESPGEDTLLSKMYSKYMVEGIQGQDCNDEIGNNKIAACVKHFAAYGAPRAGLEYAEVELSQSTLWNDYFPGYKEAVDSGVKFVMTSFNLLNGIPCTGNIWLNKDILRGKFGFNGVLISDYAAIEELTKHGFTKDAFDSASIAFESTVDIDMKTSVYANNLLDVVKIDNKKLDLLNTAVLRILRVKNELGLFENPYRGVENEDRVTSILSSEHLDLSKNMAEESVVMLKNSRNILPLKKDLDVALIGPYIKEKATLGFWAITGENKDTITLEEGVKNLSDSMNWRVSYALGCPMVCESEIKNYGKYAEKIERVSVPEDKLREEAIEISSKSDVIILAVGESTYQSGEAGSRSNPCIPDHQIKLIKKLKKIGKPIVLIVYAGRPLIMSDIIDDVDAILYAWYPGTMGGQALANLISGNVNPSGKLSMTFPRNVGQIPIYYNTYKTGRPIDYENYNHRFYSKYLDEKVTPLFSFGYGLSYSNFIYKNFKVDNKSLKQEEKLKVSITIENRSEYIGKEIVQLYIDDMYSTIVRPRKELKAFKKVLLKPFEEVEVSFSITEEMLSFYDNEGELHFELGEFKIFVGSSSEDEMNQCIISID